MSENRVGETKLREQQELAAEAARSKRSSGHLVLENCWRGGAGSGSRGSNHFAARHPAIHQDFENVGSANRRAFADS